MRNASRTAAAVAAALSLALAAAVPQPSEARTRQPASVVAGFPHLVPHVFVRGNAKLFNPDAIAVAGGDVYVVFQNASDTSPAPSTLVKYDRRGKMLGAVNLSGRCDGMRYDPFTHKLWALVNNDGLNGSPPRQPSLFTIDPVTLLATQYAFPAKQAHGGGYDDLAFIGGRAFLSASSPTLTAGGANNGPAVVEAKLGNGQVLVNPILYGNAVGLDKSTGKRMRLNITDPDSLAVDTSGDLVLVSEGDQQLIIIRDPGTTGQSVVRFGLGTQLDDVAWTRGTSGVLFVADVTLNVVYLIDATFPRGTVFVEAPQGGPVSSFVGTADATGILTPILTPAGGIVNPGVLIFVGSSP